MKRVDAQLDLYLDDKPRTLSTALRLVVIATAAALAVELITWNAPVTAVALGAGIVAATVMLLGWTLREAYEERARVVAALTALGLSPVLGMAAWNATAASTWAKMAAGFTCAALGFAAAFAWAGRAHCNWLPRITAGAALMTAAALVAALPAASNDRLAFVASLPGDGSSSESFDQVLPIAGESYSLGRSCMGRSCFAYVRHDSEVRSFGPRFARGAQLSLWHDATSHRFVVSADAQPIALAEDLNDWSVPGVIRTAPPPSFVALAGVALLGAIVWLVRRRALTNQLAALPALVTGELDAGGWLHVDGVAPPLRLGIHEEPGPVVLLDDHAASVSAYRAAARGEPARLYRGDRGALALRLTRAMSVADAFALSWIVVLATPLAVALVMRLW